jgi:hypothetical protein
VKPKEVTFNKENTIEIVLNSDSPQELFDFPQINMTMVLIKIKNVMWYGKGKYHKVLTDKFININKQTEKVGDLTLS